MQLVAQDRNKENEHITKYCKDIDWLVDANEDCHDLTTKPPVNKESALENT